MIYWNEHWHPICATRFAEDRHGTNLFCKKLDFVTGQATLNFTVANSEDAFALGKCNVNDQWPNCKGGCNNKNVGHRCYWTTVDGKLNHYTDCREGSAPKLFITCSGPTITDSITSCRGNEIVYSQNF